MSGYRLRSPGITDVEAVARVHVQGWAETYRDQLPEEFFGDAALEHRRRMWTAVLGDDGFSDRRVMIAEAGGVCIGFGLAGPAMDEEQPAPAGLQLYALYVVADHHGSGAGQELLDAVIGDDEAFLWVAKINPRAQRFYERNGFRTDGVEKPDDRVPNFWEVRMVRNAQRTG